MSPQKINGIFLLIITFLSTDNCYKPDNGFKVQLPCKINKILNTYMTMCISRVKQ